MIRYWSWIALLVLSAIPVGSLPEFHLCGFRQLTGLLCPLCGMTHGLLHWMHGDWREALRWHLLTPIPFFGLLLLPFERYLKYLPKLTPFVALIFLIYAVLRWCAIVLE